MSQIGSRRQKRFKIRATFLSCIDNVLAVKFAFWEKINLDGFVLVNVNSTTEGKQIVTHKDFTLRGWRMNVNSSFKSVTAHFAWMPFSPTSSEHEQPPVQLLAKASERTEA